MKRKLNLDDQKYGKVVDLYLKWRRRHYTKQSLKVMKQRLKYWPKLIGFSDNAKAVNLLSVKRIEKALKSLEMKGVNKNSVINYVTAVLRLKRWMFPKLDQNYAVNPAKWSRTDKGARSGEHQSDIPDFDLMVQIARKRILEEVPGKN